MRIMFAGGGTGGHIYPALSVIRKLREKDPKVAILFIGSDRGLEKRLMKESKIDFIPIKVQGLRRSFSWRNFQAIGKFLKTIPEAKKIIKKFKPDIVVGTGGYVSAPILYEASRLTIKTLIFEPNSYPGLANRILAKKVDCVAISDQNSAQFFPSKKIAFTGNPRSQEVYESSLNSVEISKGNIKLPQVLIFGGSLGALKINEATEQMIQSYKIKNFNLIFATGRRYYDAKKNFFEKLQKKENVTINPYIDHMLDLLPQISLMICRSGATTIAELTALGVPAILIPSPNVTHDHQTYNATTLSNLNAAILLPEDQLSAAKLYKLINELISDSKKLSIMKKNAFKLGQRHATDHFIEVLKKLINEDSRK